MDSQAEKRRFRRAAFQSPGRLIDALGITPVTVIDLSLRGALIETLQAWSGCLEDRCQLKVELAPGVFIAMWATVAHLEGNQVGLRCDHIDHDSITHLRRLVELNSGDPWLLDRELANLINP